MEIIQGKKPGPRRVMLYGTHGIGKSTWASQAKTPIFLQCEEGLDDIGADRTPLLTSIAAVTNVFSWLGQEDHGYKTVVIDTLDWLEQLVWQQTCDAHNKNSIEEFGYGKGYLHAIKGWKWILSNLMQLRGKGMNIVLLAHAKITRFEAPDGDSYDRYEPDLHKTVSPLLQEWCDEVFFANYQVSTVKQDEGFGRERTRAVGSGDRTMFTCEMPTHLAKRRLKMEDSVPLTWAAYRECWPEPTKKPGGDIAGIVKDGSSKPQQKKAS